MNCDRDGATYHLACDCREAAMRDDNARLTRERDEARECAAEIPGLRLRLAQTEDSATQAEAAWKTEYERRVAAEAKAEALAKAAKKRLAEIPHHDEGSCRRIDCGDCALRAALAEVGE